MTSTPTHRHVDIAVIGGGAAGLAAAASARKAGAQDVVVFDREASPGGILKQCIHNGFGLHRFREELTGPEYAAREFEAAMSCGVALEREATVIAIEPACGKTPWSARPRGDVSGWGGGDAGGDGGGCGEGNLGSDGGDAGGGLIVTVVSPALGVQLVHAEAVVLAMGSRERTRGALGIPGTRPVGIYTAGTAQRMINLEGIIPGKEVVLLGSGDIGLIVARRLAYEGAHVKAVYNRSHISSGLKRNIVQCLDDYGIPLNLLHTVTSIYGKDRIRAVGISEVDRATKQAIPGTEEIVECDTLLLAVGLLPENELTRSAGIAIDPRSNGAVVNERYETSMPGVFSAGNVLHIHDLVDFVSEEGDAAGKAAASYVLEKRKSRAMIAATPTAQTSQSSCTKLTPGGGVSYVVPQQVQAGAQGKIPVRFRVKDVFAPAQIKIVAGGKTIKQLKRPVLAPAEMVTITIDGKLVAGHEEVTISASAAEAESRPPTRKATTASGANERGRDKATGTTWQSAAKTLQPPSSSATTQNFICVSCPVGCELEVVMQDGQIASVSGNSCARGEAYARSEATNPTRTLTMLVDVQGSEMPASCKTSEPIPKRLLPQCIASLRSVRLGQPAAIGDVVAENICGIGVSVVATKDVPAL